MDAPGGMEHCVIEGTPSEYGVRTCSWPCQCTVVGASSRAFVTVTSTQSPSSTTMVGPGTVPLAVMYVFVAGAGSAGLGTTSDETVSWKVRVRARTERPGHGHDAFGVPGVNPAYASNPEHGRERGAEKVDPAQEPASGEVAGGEGRGGET